MTGLVSFIGVAAFTILFFVGGWWLGGVIRNYSIVDAMWSFAIGLAGGVYAIAGSGSSSKRFVAGLVAALWGFRLASYLVRRIARHHPQEDVRYQKLRDLWKDRVVASFFWFFLSQGVSVLFLSLPYFLIAQDNTSWSVFESIGLTIIVIGLSGEFMSDYQMVRFKKSGIRSGGVCQEGLWKYSRHPNYFFEMVFWVGLYVFACGSAWGWATLFAPVTITYLLLNVTGIPPTEALALQSKGEAYRLYQRTTSAFIPLPPKSI